MFFLQSKPLNATLLEEITDLVVRRGANACATDNDGKNALHYLLAYDPMPVDNAGGCGSDDDDEEESSEEESEQVRGHAFAVDPTYVSVITYQFDVLCSPHCCRMV